MEPMTALVMAFQLLALFSIAGGLLIYLICKVRQDAAHDATAAAADSSQTTTVLITSADTALGLQLCTYLANKGCRVFAGMKDTEDSLPAKLLKGWVNMRESNEDPVRGSIVLVQLDVTREDVLRELTSGLGAYLHSGVRGISAVINTSGSMFRGRIDGQDIQQWDNMLKVNILGSFRVARAFIGFLRPTRGRLIYLGAGAGDGGDGLVAFNTSRMAVEKCVQELRKEWQAYDVPVIALDTCGIPAESLYKPPVPQTSSETNEGGAPLQYSANVLSAAALQVIDRALWDPQPEERYQLNIPNSKYNFMLPCRSSLRMSRTNNVGGGNNATANRVQRV